METCINRTSKCVLLLRSAMIGHRLHTVLCFTYTPRHLSLFTCIYDVTRMTLRVFFLRKALSANCSTTGAWKLQNGTHVRIYTQLYMKCKYKIIMHYNAYSMYIISRTVLGSHRSVLFSFYFNIHTLNLCSVFYTT